MFLTYRVELGPYLINFTSSIWPVNIICSPAPAIMNLCLPPLNFEPTGNIYAYDHKRVTWACDCVRAQNKGHTSWATKWIHNRIQRPRPWATEKFYCVRCIVLVKLLASYLHKLRSKETPHTASTDSNWILMWARVFRKPRWQFYYVLFIMFWQLKSAKVCHSEYEPGVLCILCTHARYVRSRNDFVTFHTIGINYIKMGFTVSCVSTRAHSIYCFACFDFAI